MRILVAGARGQVAQALKRARLNDGEQVVVMGRPELDITDREGVGRVIAEVRPDVVVNAAAFTNVEAAEDDVESARQVNALGARYLAEATGSGVPLIHLSTDYVFDGTKAEPYEEDDVVNPINAYGQSKLEGEQMVAAANPDHVILRTSWVFSPWSNNFLKTMLKLARDRDEISVVDDQVGAPTSADAIAEGVLGVARGLRSGSSGAGVFHMTAGGEASWADLAEAIFEESRRRGGPSASVVRITSEAYPTRAARPRNSRLDCSKLRAQWCIALPHWRDSVGACVAEVVEAERLA